ncbi:hypothetical protein ECANGB1_1127 [Enterospora canceri]|uniref:Uncharacterized protein n=1 Tax=Enterospora canceri TaxID=1081671 RepID=A0A1Y1S439_9MICR|nr:hypothetical protein ECANGB1_1127 [Enterospora canceri]
MNYLIIVKAAIYFERIRNKEREYIQHRDTYKKEVEMIEIDSCAFKSDPLEVSYAEFEKLYRFFIFRYNNYNSTEDGTTKKLKHMSHRLPKVIDLLEERYNKGNDGTKYKTRTEIYVQLYKCLMLMLDVDLYITRRDALVNQAAFLKKAYLKHIFKVSNLDATRIIRAHNALKASIYLFIGLKAKYETYKKSIKRLKSIIDVIDQQYSGQ